LADQLTTVECEVLPLIVADAERFQAEYDWPGGVPAPSVYLRTTPTETSAVNTGGLGATGNIQTWQFTAAEAAPYTFLPLRLAVSTSSGSLTRAEAEAFWFDEAGLIMSGPDYSFINTAPISSVAPIEPTIADVRVRRADFSNKGYGVGFLSGAAIQAGGLSVSFEVDTYVAQAAGSQMNAYPTLAAIGWPARVMGIGALRLPGMGMN
jgi:hypothetical protein